MSKFFNRRLWRSIHSGRVSVKSEGGIVEVHLASQRKNAMCFQMMEELSGCLDALHRKHDDVFGLILSGENNTFCAGFDLKTATLEQSDIASRMCTIMHANYIKFASLPLVTIAAIEGYALGGGAELASWCDHRVMAENAIIRFLQAKMGVSPGWGGGVALSVILGRSKALQIFCDAKKMNSMYAKEIGFADKVTKAGASLNASKEFLKNYLDSSDGSMNAIRGIKKALMVDPEILRAALAREKNSFMELWGAEDNKKAILNSLEALKKK